MQLLTWVPTVLLLMVLLTAVPLAGQTVTEESPPDTMPESTVRRELTESATTEPEGEDTETFLAPLVQPDEIFGTQPLILPSSHLQPRPLLVPQPEVAPQVQLPNAANSRFQESTSFGGRNGIPLAAGAGSIRRVGSTSVPGSEARARSTSDSGSILDRSPMILGVGVQRRTPIVSDPRIRGSRVGTLAASGSYWVPARLDLDTMLSKIDSRIVSNITVIKGPYSSLYGPGSNFVDVQLKRTPRYEQSEIHGSTSLDYKTNGQQWYGRQSFWGGDENSGFRVGFGDKEGNDYQSGNGTNMPASYHSQDFDVAFGYDFTPNSHIEFNYLRLDQTNVLFPGQAFDINYLVTDAFEVGYELTDSDFSDRINIDAWYNRTRFQGDNLRPSKRVQFPLYNFLGFKATTDVDSMSTGTRASSTWNHTEVSSTTAGVDFREIRQDLNEIGVAPGLGVTNPSNSPVPRSSSANPGLFFEHVASPWEALKLTFGSRVDLVDAELNASANSIAALGLSNPQASLANLLGTSHYDRNFTLFSLFATGEYALNDNWLLTAAAGRGQRAPNLTEMYAAGPFMFLLQNGLNTVTGDPSLKAERTFQMDVGTQYNSDVASAGLTGFYAWTRDFITFENVKTVTGPPYNSVEQVNLQFVNTDLATLGGFEAHAQYEHTGWLTSFATMNYVAGTDRTRNGNFATKPGTATKPKKEDPNHVRGFYSHTPGDSQEPLPQILPLQSRLGIRLHEEEVQPRWNVELSTRIVDRQRRVATSLLEQPTPGFTLWDLRGTWQASRKLLLVSGIENFTNKNFQEHLDYRPQPGGGSFRTLQPGVLFYFGSEVNY
ncbi:MAG: TonB-dependent receptor [Planctomycetaceae bacterium]|nr:TonB-dependent receptor [Planctomycetaceae bacterium]